ncbi:BglII/BstYI family type II restriction endonuclease [Neobacillus sp. D3-1R]|uniref:BglII/BstYI family type II restriction endonuclease n=1 Tax=Neobacillus sp. D3-1R TaxID=3445778 RepID=UPI003F9F67F6
MEYKLYSHRYAVSILENEQEFAQTWSQVIQAVTNISEEMIIQLFENRYSNQKSISKAINHLMRDEFAKFNWREESPIFQDPNYDDKTWRLDFAKENISIEVAFNHSGVIAWNLLKPVLASELNHVQKAIQTKLGVIICATEAMRAAGGFDNAVGTFEKFITHFAPLQNQLSVPIAMIGLEAPKTFYIEHIPSPTNPRSKIGRVVRK